MQFGDKGELIVYSGEPEFSIVSGLSITTFSEDRQSRLRDELNRQMKGAKDLLYEMGAPQLLENPGNNDALPEEPSPEATEKLESLALAFQQNLPFVVPAEYIIDLAQHAQEIADTLEAAKAELKLAREGKLDELRSRQFLDAVAYYIKDDFDINEATELATDDVYNPELMLEPYEVVEAQEKKVAEAERAANLANFLLNH